MRILTRYVFREFLVPLGYCLTGFVAIYILFELFGSFSRLMDASLPFGQVVLYFAGYLAPYFHYLAPASLLLATLYTMWMFCRHSEIVAMRASGVSFMTIVKPLLAVALGLALFVFYVNESFVPRHAHFANRLKSTRFNLEKMMRADNIVYRNAPQGRTWNVNALAAADGSALKDVRVTVDRPNGGARLMAVTAERAEHLDGEWWFFKPTVQHYDANGQEIASPHPELEQLPVRCFAEFRERPTDFLLQNRPWKYNSVRERLRYLDTHPELLPERRQDLLYDVWTQLLSPWACLVITLLAIPAGIASGRQSVFKGVLGALGLYFAFYGLSIGCMILAKTGCFPAAPAALLPYILFTAIGVIAFRRQR